MHVQALGLVQERLLEGIASQMHQHEHRSSSISAALGTTKNRKYLIEDIAVSKPKVFGTTLRWDLQKSYYEHKFAGTVRDRNTMAL